MTKIELLLLFFLIILIPSNAQNSTSSPYSVFGVGRLASRGDVATLSMGHAGVALPSEGWINTINPASLSSLDSTTFYFNMQVDGIYSKIGNSSQSKSNINGNIGAVTMGFRAARGWGMSLGYTPFSNVGYSIQSSKYLLGTNTVYPVVYDGSGGLSQIYWANSVKVIGGLSLGLNISYLWGNLKSTELSTYPALNAEDIYNEKTHYMNNFYLEYGLQYQAQIGKHKVGVGAVANMKTKLGSTYRQRIFNDYTSGISDEESDFDDFTVPQSYRAGLSWDIPSGFLFAADYGLQNWKSIDNPKSESALYLNNQSFNFGVEYSARKKTYMNYLRRMKYRAGVLYNSGYLKIKSVRLEEKGFTTGLAFPLGNKGNMLNLGYEYVKFGSGRNGLLTEFQHTIRIGLSVNEPWFMKRQFD